jgi:hypothetical protein
MSGIGETIQSYNHKSYHRPHVLDKTSSKLMGSCHDDDIDVGKAGDEMMDLESKCDFIFLCVTYAFE